MSFQRNSRVFSVKAVQSSTELTKFVQTPRQHNQYAVQLLKGVKSFAQGEPMNETIASQIPQVNPNPAAIPLLKRPALVAAATWWLVFLLLAVVTLFTGWASRPITLYLQLLASLGAGVQAAWLYRRWNPEGSQYVRQGAFAGLYLPLASAAVLIVTSILLAIGSLGAVLLLTIPYFLFLPIEIGGCSLSGAFGAWIYRKLFAR